MLLGIPFLSNLMETKFKEGSLSTSPCLHLIFASIGTNTLSVSISG